MSAVIPDDVRPCWPKRKFFSRDSALRMAKVLPRRGDYVKSPGKLQAYHCPKCGDWHVGHG